MDRNAGFDLLLGFRGRLYAIEVKDPAQPPSKRRLTVNEQLTAAAMALVDVPHNVCETLTTCCASCRPSRSNMQKLEWNGCYDNGWQSAPLVPEAYGIRDYCAFECDV